MTRQTTAPLEDYRFQPSARTAHEVSGVMYRQMDINPPYQRGHVWTEDQRIALVKSWLMGLPIPAVVINDRSTRQWSEKNNGDVYRRPGAAIYAVVDGKQRIETARLWFAGELAVPASWFKPDYIDATHDTDDGSYINFNELSEVGQRKTKFHFQLPMIEARLDSVQAEAEMYLIVNGGGTMQTEADMANAAHVAGR